MLRIRGVGRRAGQCYTTIPARALGAELAPTWLAPMSRKGVHPYALCNAGAMPLAPQSVAVRPRLRHSGSHQRSPAPAKHPCRNTPARQERFTVRPACGHPVPMSADHNQKPHCKSREIPTSPRPPAWLDQPLAYCARMRPRPSTLRTPDNSAPCSPSACFSVPFALLSATASSPGPAAPRAQCGAAPRDPASPSCTPPPTPPGDCCCGCC